MPNNHATMIIPQIDYIRTKKKEKLWPWRPLFITLWPPVWEPLVLQELNAPWRH